MTAPHEHAGPSSSSLLLDLTLEQVEQNWSTARSGTALNGTERRATAVNCTVRPGDSLFQQVRAACPPDWQCEGQGFESPQLHAIDGECS